jgi:RNA polymerase sigma factor (TIGR02999 family)
MITLERSRQTTYSESKHVHIRSGLGVAMPESSADITRLLQGWCNGEEGALEDLTPLIFDDLRRMASRYLRREPFRTLQSTALVNEVFVRLLNRDSLTWKNRSHFFGFVAQEMRRILVDHARRKRADRRGGGEQPASLDEAMAVAEERDINLVALGDALKDLQRADPELSQVVDLRFVVGLSHQQIADVMETSVATVRRRWETARTWLYREVVRKESFLPTADVAEHATEHSESGQDLMR